MMEEIQSQDIEQSWQVFIASFGDLTEDQHAIMRGCFMAGVACLLDAFLVEELLIAGCEDRVEEIIAQIETINPARMN